MASDRLPLSAIIFSDKHNSSKGDISVIYACRLLVIGLVFYVSGCGEDEKVSENAVELSVDFSWEGMQPCRWGNPEIRVSGVPDKTNHLQISMYDHEYIHDHGTVTMLWVGVGNFAKGAFEGLQGPCPSGNPGRYEITVKAIDEHEVVIGVGSRERRFPEKE